VAITFKTSAASTRVETMELNLVPVLDGEAFVQIYAVDQG
jgi:hypothetical protein